MRISDINIYNFRNYSKLFLEFDKRMNIFIGNNGEGKTNILESIYVLAITKSHRSYIDKNLITNEKALMRLNGTIVSDKAKKSLELFMNPKGKRVSINGNIVKRVSDYISNFTVVLFCPDDLELVKGSPGVRRKYLNIEIGQLDNKYLFFLNEYNELLKNRNEYLKRINFDKVDKNYIDIINNQLCDKADEIYKYRFKYIDELNKNIKSIYSDIVDEGSIEIKYISSIDICKYNGGIKEILKRKLDESLKREILQGNTLYGPHRDDFEIFINNKSVREYGSQGQQRISVLCMKFGELEIFKQEKNEYPILLLDDIFSELDKEKKNSIVKYLKKDIQVFITTTDVNDINPSILDGASIYNIKNGGIV